MTWILGGSIVVSAGLLLYVMWPESRGQSKHHDVCDRCGWVDSPEGYGHCANCDAYLCGECLSRDNVSGESFCPNDAHAWWGGCPETAEAVAQREIRR